ncbi:MAG: serine/threonine-protein kinase, partial [Planctomycetota bacterium]|nr:serine/threonine-protein kinase [Planctomycetota bacterium]
MDKHSVSSRWRDIDLSFTRRLDLACDEFEARWGTGGALSLEDVLMEFEESDRQHVIRELVGVEIELRCSKGETPGRGDYERQFANYHEAIQQAFAEYSLGDETIIENLPAQEAGHGVARVVANSRSGVVANENRIPEQIGKYRVVEQLDSGGQGAVFRATHPDLGRDVVIKLGHSDVSADPGAMELLRTEGKLLAGMEHPNLAQIFDFDVDNGRPFLVMEFIRGLNLKQFVRQTSPDNQTSIRILAKVAAAMDYVHRRGILHLDLKPHNILIKESGEPCVIDFGLARLESVWSDDRPLPYSLSGTLCFMAPEQARSEGTLVGPASDIYGLGGVLYFLLTGSYPITLKSSGTEPDSASFHDLLERAKKGDWDRSLLDQSIPSVLRSICYRAMALEPQDRYPSAADLASALNHFLTSRRRIIFIAGGSLLAGVSIALTARFSSTNEPPLQLNTAVTPQLQSEFSVRTWRDGRYLNLVDSVPLISDDRISLNVTVPMAMHISIFSFDTEGHLSLVYSQLTADRGESVRYPTDPTQAVPLEGPPGTELLLVCGRAERPISRDELLAIPGFNKSLPHLPPDSVLSMRAEGVNVVQRGRGLGISIDSPDP